MDPMQLGGRYLTERELKNVGFKRLGRHVQIHSRASIYRPENILVGDHVRIDDFAVIIATGPLAIGNYVSIHNFCYLGGTYGIVLNDFVTLAPGAMIFTSSDDYSGHDLTGPVVPRSLSGGDKGEVVLKSHVIVGARSIILPGCTLGEGVSIGALSLVKTHLKGWGIYAGIPVKRIKDRSKRVLILEKRMRKTRGKR